MYLLYDMFFQQSFIGFTGYNTQTTLCVAHKTYSGFLLAVVSADIKFWHGRNVWEVVRRADKLYANVVGDGAWRLLMV